MEILTIKAIDFTEYSHTYYVEIKKEDGKIETYEKISGEKPIEIAKLFKPDAKPCKKEDSSIYIVSNGWRFGEKVKHNYYK